MLSSPGSFSVGVDAMNFPPCFSNAYNMVLHKCGDVLYNGVKNSVDEHLKEVSEEVASAMDDNFLVEINKAWTDHKVSMLMIRDILMYMVSSADEMFCSTLCL